MDEVLEGVFRFFATLIRFVFWVILVQIVLFNLGRVVLLLLSLGRFPHQEHLERYQELIITAGIGVLLLAWVAIATYNNLGPAA